MGKPVDSYGNLIAVEVKLRRAADFMTFDPLENSLSIKGIDMNKDLHSTPYYHVTIESLYTDIFGIEKYFRKDI